jgi:hypothetical protein
MNPSDRITAYIDALGDWRGQLLGRLRRLIRSASPDLVEEWKWNHVKLNFFRGASLADPRGLFNAGLEAKTSRAIDLHQGDRLDEAALRDLVRAAVVLERKPSKPKSRSKR